MESGMPPVPPQIAAQQGPSALRQFAQNSGAAPEAQPSSDELLGQYTNQVGQILTKIAQVTGQTKPELIPILKQAVQAMAMFAGKIKTGQQQGAPQGGDQGTQQSATPDAAGGAAMGMQQ